MKKFAHAVFLVVAVMLPVAACERGKAEEPMARESLPGELGAAISGNKCQGPGVDCTAENLCCPALTCTQQSDGVFRCVK